MLEFKDRLSQRMCAVLNQSYIYQLVRPDYILTRRHSSPLLGMRKDKVSCKATCDEPIVGAEA